jgi:hypothetical protein
MLQYVVRKRGGNFSSLFSLFLYFFVSFFLGIKGTVFQEHHRTILYFKNRENILLGEDIFLISSLASVTHKIARCVSELVIKGKVFQDLR